VTVATIPIGPRDGFGTATSDLIDLSGTVLAGVATNTIVLRDVRAEFYSLTNAFSLSEIAVDGSRLPDEPPTVTVPHDLVLEATGAAGAVATFTATASDAEDGTLVPTCDHASGSTFPFGTTTVTCTATDTSGQSATGTFDITVVDTTAPVLAFAGDAATYAVDATIDISVTATDLADPSVELTCALRDGEGALRSPACHPLLGAWVLGLGSFTLGAVATDDNGNVTSGMRTFVVKATYPSVANLTRTWVWKAGVAKDLIALLDAAAALERKGNLQGEASKLRDYRAAVTAQLGKSISADDAARLIAFSSGL
jgi:hypothetical protein